MSLCSWLVEGTGGKGSSAGLPGSIEAQTCVANMDGCLVNWRKSRFPFLCQCATGYHQICCHQHSIQEKTESLSDI